MKNAILLFLVCLCLTSNAKKFVIDDFFHDPNDLVARSSAKQDINGDRCAIIRVYTDISNLSFDSNMGITASVKQANNQIWLYVSPGEKRLEISAPDFMTESYVLPIKIEPASVYVIRLTSDEAPLRVVAGQGNLSLTTDPPGAKVYLEGVPTDNKVTPVDFENINALDYKLILSRENYFTLDTTVSVQAEKNTSIRFQLIPKFSDVTITSIPEGAVVFIDDVEKGRTPLRLSGEINGLSHGEHLITLSHKDCYDFNKNIEIKPDAENEFNFEMNQISGTLSIRTIPDGATIRVDNHFLGLTPIFNHKVNKGKRILDISKEGYSGIRRQIEIGENEQLILLDTMVASKNISISTKPEGAQFFANGLYLGVTPLRIPMVKEMNDFKFVMDDYVDKEIRENITGEKLKFEYKMDLQQYEVKVNSEPLGANVYVKGELKGVTPCKVYLPNEKVRIKWEKSGFIPKQKKLKPGDSDFEVVGEMRERVKESETVGFSFEIWKDKEYKARFDVGNLFILKYGWQTFDEKVPIEQIEFKGLGNAEMQLSPTFPITRYGELSPYAGIGYEWGVSDSTNIFQSTISPDLHSYFYSFGTYVYINVINNIQLYMQFAYSGQLGKVEYNDEDLGYEYLNDKKWDEVFNDRYKFKMAFGIRIRLGGS